MCLEEFSPRRTSNKKEHNLFEVCCDAEEDSDVSNAISAALVMGLPADYIPPI